jgi:AcrR family transcriptional regulator
MSQDRPDINVSFEKLALQRRVLTVARQQFARKGVEDTQLADIALLLRMPEHELLTLFHSKSDLLMAVFDEGWSPIVARLARVVADSKTARDATIAMFSAMIQLLEKDPALARLLLFEAHRIEPATHKVRLSNGYLRFHGLCIEVAERGQRDGSFRTALHPRIIVSALISAVVGLLRDKALAQGDSLDSPFTQAQLVAAFSSLTAGFAP